MAGYTDAARLVSGTNLRATMLALRGGVDRFEPPPDPALVDLVARSYDSIAGTVDGLTWLEARPRERGDRRAVFLTIDVYMTREVEARRFADPEWMRGYLLTFTEYYRQSFPAFERGDLAGVPDPWRVAFGAAVDGDDLVV